jgi:hypothetical protein
MAARRWTLIAEARGAAMAANKTAEYMFERWREVVERVR